MHWLCTHHWKHPFDFIHAHIVLFGINTSICKTVSIMNVKLNLKEIISVSIPCYFQRFVVRIDFFDCYRFFSHVDTMNIGQQLQCFRNGININSGGSELKWRCIWANQGAVIRHFTSICMLSLRQDFQLNILIKDT